MSEYIETAIGAPKAQALKKLKESYSDINKMPTRSIVWAVVKRHKFGLVSTLCVLQFAAYTGGLQVLADLVITGIVSLF